MFIYKLPSFDGKSKDCRLRNLLIKAWFFSRNANARAHKLNAFGSCMDNMLSINCAIIG